MEVPEESFHWSSWDSRTCYPRRAFIQGLSDDSQGHIPTLDQENEKKSGNPKRENPFKELEYSLANEMKPL